MTHPTPLDPPVRLEELVRGVTATHTDVLDRLSTAVLAGEHLGAVADQLIGHFVEEARDAGASWRDIGASMGVTKQAAQKRFVDRTVPERPPLHPSQGFTRFTEAARNALAAAHNAAVAGSHAEVTPAHVLLGLVAAPDSDAVGAILAQGVTLEAVAEAARALLPSPVTDGPELVPYDAAARKVIELAFREALRLGASDVGSGHLLLALLRAKVTPPDALMVDAKGVVAYLAQRANDGEAGVA